MTSSKSKSLEKELKSLKNKVERIKKTRIFYADKPVSPATSVSELLTNVTVNWEYCDGAIGFWSHYGKDTQEYKNGGYTSDDDRYFADDIMNGDDSDKQHKLLEKLNDNYDQLSGINIEYFDLGDILYDL